MYEKFRRQSNEYAAYRQHQINQIENCDEVDPEVLSNKKKTYSIQFVNKLLSTSQNLDIEISGDIFDKSTTIQDL
jgi:hypothetical protein